MTTRLLKTKEAASYLSCSPWKLRELVHDEKIPHIVVDEDDGAWRFDVGDLQKFIDSWRKFGA
jgi:excisionase family DNA binding protein